MDALLAWWELRTGNDQRDLNPDYLDWCKAQWLIPSEGYQPYISKAPERLDYWREMYNETKIFNPYVASVAIREISRLVGV